MLDMGSGGMGTGSDTRMYNPRSEASHLYSVEDERGEYKHGIGDDKDMEERRDKAQIQQEAEKVKDLPHLKIDIEHANPPPSEMPPEMPPEGEEPQMNEDENAVGAEVSQLTGMPGSSGHQLDEAVGAKTGTGSAMGGYRPLLATGEPMENAWSSLRKAAAAKIGGHSSHQSHKPWSAASKFESFPNVRQPTRANPARAKMISRILSEYGRGPGGGPEALERQHLGRSVKQPLRLFPEKYKHYRGIQEARRIRGGVPMAAAGSHGTKGERSSVAGATGAGRIRSLAGEQQGTGAITSHAPAMRTGQQMKPSTSMFKADLERIQGLLLKAKSPVDYLHFSQLRAMLRRLKKVMEDKESRLKATANFQGGPGEVGHRDGGTTNPQGATENIESEERKSENAGLTLVSRGSGRVA
tara:strand:- start:294 stop:1529 length:1236 start_codon:yes stop_codon:yes gene_type:complete